MDPKYQDRRVRKIWSEGGRFERMFRVEVLNCEAWFRQGVIPEEEMVAIRSGAAFNRRVYAARFKTTRHDVGSFVFSVAHEIDRWAEAKGITSKPGRWFHYNLTSYDVWDTALAMQIGATLRLTLHELRELRKYLRQRGIEHWKTVRVGRTHGTHAEPSTFGALLANYDSELARLEERILQQIEEWKIVKISGPVGTHERVPAAVEEFIARQLHGKPINIATQIIPRTLILGYLDLLDEIGGLIEKMGVDLRYLQTPEIFEVEEHFPDGAEGSSIMVHKHNPEVLERCCSLARLLLGYVVTARQNTVNWHERDLTTSANERVILPDSAHTVVYILKQMGWVIKTLHVHPKRMAANLNLTQGLVKSGVVLNRMVEEGADRASARKLIEYHVRGAWDQHREGIAMPEISGAMAQDPEILRYLRVEQVLEIFRPDYSALLEGVKVSFSRLGWKIPV